MYIDILERCYVEMGIFWREGWEVIMRPAPAPPSPPSANSPPSETKRHPGGCATMS